MKRNIINELLFVFVMFISYVNGIAQENSFPWCNGNFQRISLPYGTYDFCGNGQWIMVFEDEFDNNQLDLSKWRESPNQQGGLFLTNLSQEYRTLDNVIVSGGSMKIVAKDEVVYKRAFKWKPDNEILIDGLPNLRQYDYTSSLVESKFKMSYGKVEASVRIPKGRGFWPGFWLYSGDPWNEIDIFEYWNQHDSNGDFDLMTSVKTHNITSHYAIDNSNHRQCATSYYGIDASADSQVYSVIYDRNRTEYYANNTMKRYDVRYYTDSWQETGCQIYGGLPYELNLAYPIDPMRIIFSLYIQNEKEVNGTIIDESPDITTPFPSEMQVNWVRYYQRHPYTDVSITNSSQYPIEPELYNVIAGRNVEIDCEYVVPENECLTILAENCIILNPGFLAEQGSTSYIKANQNLYGNGARDGDVWPSSNSDTKNEKISNMDVFDAGTEIFDEPIKFSTKITSFNSSNDDGFIEFDGTSIYDVVVYDLFGRLIKSFNNIKSLETPFELSTLSNGIYIVYVLNKSSQEQFVKKLVIR